MSAVPEVDENIPETNNIDHEIHPLENATFAPVPKKRGRPKGSVTTAIGLPRSKRQKFDNEQKIPFHKKPTKTREVIMLKWFLDNDTVDTVLQGIRAQESDVETVPENLPSSIMDKNIDINLIRKFFDNDAWTLLLSVLEVRKNLPWLCSICNADLSQVRSVGCDSCLSWLHYSCAGIKKEPSCKYWYCKSCK